MHDPVHAGRSNGDDVAIVLSRLEGLRPPDELRAVVERELHRFESVRVHDFVPLFVERRVRAQLAGRGLTGQRVLDHQDEHARNVPT